MKNAEIEKLATDYRLDSHARSVALFVGARGKGNHEISYDELGRLLHTRTRRIIKGAVAKAEETGWLRVTKGGGGHSNSYEFVAPSDRDESARSDEVQTVTNQHGLSKSDRDESALSKSDRDESARSDSDILSDRAESARSDEDILPDRAESARSDRPVGSSSSSSNPPIVPPSAKGNSPSGNFPLDGRVHGELEDDRWHGCRGAVMDYFRDRVRTGEQWGYLMSLRTWLDGGVNAPRGFVALEPDQQRSAIAGALNALLAEGAEFERKEYRSARGRIGNLRTLYAKLEYMIRRHHEVQQELPLNGGDGDATVPPGYELDAAGRLQKRMDDLG